MRTRAFLVAGDVRRLMEAARVQAGALGLPVSVAIVDEAGVLLLMERLDGARLHTPEAAWMKARTAAIVRVPTATLEEQVRANPAMLLFPGRLPLAGGLPIMRGDDCLGGIGCSGGQPDEDEKVCRAALALVDALATSSDG